MFVFLKIAIKSVEIRELRCVLELQTRLRYFKK